MMRPTLSIKGLSPRVRGKPNCWPPAMAANRSIPACAGEARPGAGKSAISKVYPRVCGGSGSLLSTCSAKRGLSPRVRGKRVAAVDLFGETRSIPACAGEACAASRSLPPSLVYPRVCGGSAGRRGGKPRRGGLSPRVRGKLGHPVQDVGGVWSIPACAGEAGNPSLICSRGMVYPRVFGGSGEGPVPGVSPGGLSPRVRGKHPQTRPRRPFPGSIPACAGEAGAAGASTDCGGLYPRVCGGSRPGGDVIAVQRGLSPRVRGKLRGRPSLLPRDRSIPACGGEACCGAAGYAGKRVYPRLCGGSPPFHRGRR